MSFLAPSISSLTCSSSFSLCSIVVSSCMVFSVVCFKVCFKLAIYLDSFPWEARRSLKKIITFVLGIFLLHFGKVFELNSFPFENGPLHVLYHLFLLLSQLLVPELHPMNFFFHSHDFRLTDVGVQGILHLLFQLDFSLPQENLSFSFHNFG